MADDGYKRKLVAILSADAVGYSRLMRDNEEATVRDLAAHRSLLRDIINQHNGRVIDSPGDNLLAEFASVVDAVNGAVNIQEEIKDRNADIPEHRRMEFRIGINLGDVIEEKGRIYGDGVNIAARLEGLAEAGGIPISGTVYEHVQNKLSYEYHYVGEQHVKNISEPLTVYHLVSESLVPGEVVGQKSSGAPRRYGLVAALAILAIALATTAIWVSTRTPVVDQEKETLPKDASPISERASIAVLPFINLSGDPEQDYFSDGITNDIITALSKFRELLVIASNTTFTYKGRAVNIEIIGNELGVRYVLEGSVQKAASKLRINTQLIETVTGFHIWAERYDREMKDIFAVQDEIVHTIVGKLAVEIDAVERKRALQKKTESLEAYDYLLRGWEYFRRRTRTENGKAREMFENAIELDPGFAAAYVGLGRTYQAQVSFGWTEFPVQVLNRVEELALKGLSLDKSNSEAYALLGLVYTFREQYDLAINKLNRAIELNPNDAKSLSNRGQVLLWAGRTDEAILSLETAHQFDPNLAFGNFMFLGIGYYLKGQYANAIRVLEEGVSRSRDWVGNHIILTAAYAQSGRLADAERQAKEVLRLDPFFEVENYGTVFQNPAHRDKIVEGLRKAGFS